MRIGACLSNRVTCPTKEVPVVITKPLPSAAPEAIRVILDRMTPSEIALVVLQLADDPVSLRSMLAAMTPSELALAVARAADFPNAVRTILEQIAPAQIPAAMVQLVATNPEIARVILDRQQEKRLAVVEGLSGIEYRRGSGKITGFEDRIRRMAGERVGRLGHE